MWLILPVYDGYYEPSAFGPHTLASTVDWYMIPILFIISFSDSNTILIKLIAYSLPIFSFQKISEYRHPLKYKYL